MDSTASQPGAKGALRAFLRRLVNMLIVSVINSRPIINDNERNEFAAGRRIDGIFHVALFYVA